MNLPPVAYISSAKNTLMLAMVAMIEVTRTKWISVALIEPSATPVARPSGMHRMPGQCQRAARKPAIYCATEAVAMNEMSMPPETSTTNRPSARMPCTE